MTRRIFILLCLTLLVAGAATAEETLEQLKERAESAAADRKPLLYAEVVQREIALADKLFTDGDAEKAHATVKEAVGYAEKCREAARQQPRKIKDAEIRLRKAERRLNEIRRTLALEDQADVQAAADRIAELRTQLLDQMFAPKRKSKDKEKP